MQNRKVTKDTQKSIVQTLKFKLIVVSMVLILISVISLAFTFIQRQKKQIRVQLINRGRTITRLMAYNARYGVQIGDKPILDKIIGGVTDDPDVIYCIITDNKEKIITSYNQERAGIEKIKKSFGIKEEKETEYRNSREEDVINIAMPVVLSSAPPEEEDDMSDLESEFFDDALESEEEELPSEPTREENVNQDDSKKRVIGTVQIGITLDNMKKDIAAAIRQTIMYSSFIIIGGFALAFWLGSLISAPIRKIVSVLNDISQGEGDLTQRIHINSNDEVGDLATGFNTFMDKFQEIKKISIFLNELADGGGDLTKRLNIPSPDEIGMLAQGFDRFTDKLHEIICQVAENTGKISIASQAVSDTTLKLARELDEVALQSNEVASSSGQISEAIESTSNNVSNVNDLMNKTEVISNTGVDIVHDTKTSMVQITDSIKESSEVVEKLNESSQKIGGTIAAITEIADQTKLIAINASIEASRVGAEGKGFSVVAEEIRRLATKVTKATKDISQRIRAIQEESLQVVTAMKRGMEQANHGLELSNKSENSLEDISQAVLDSKTKINQIAVSSNEQSSSIGIISQNINNISESAKQCSLGVTETAQSMQELNKEVQALRQLVGQFVLDR